MQIRLLVMSHSGHKMKYIGKITKNGTSLKAFSLSCYTHYKVP